MRIYKTEGSWDTIGFTAPYVRIDDDNSIILEADGIGARDVYCGEMTLEWRGNDAKKIKKSLCNPINQPEDDYDDAFEVKITHEGQVVGQVGFYRNNDVIEKILDAECAINAQQLIASLKPTEAVVSIGGFLCSRTFLKFDVDTNEINPICYISSISSVLDNRFTKVLEKIAPLYIEAYESDLDITGNPYFSLPNISSNGKYIDRLMGEGVVQSYIYFPDKIVLSSKEERALMLGYSIACLNTIAEHYNGVSQTQLVTDAYKEYLEIWNPPEKVSAPGMFAEGVPYGFKIDNNKIKDWIEEGVQHLSMREEILVDRHMKLYGKGYYYCIIRSDISDETVETPKMSYTLAEIREDNDENIQFYFIDKAFAEKLLESLPSCGYIEASRARYEDSEDVESERRVIRDIVESEKRVIRDITAYAIVKNQKPQKLFSLEIDKGVDRYAVAPAYTALALAQCGIVDKDILQAAQSLSIAMGENGYGKYSLMDQNLTCEFVVGEKPDRDIKNTVRERLSEKDYGRDLKQENIEII